MPAKPKLKDQGFIGLKTSMGLPEEEFIRDLRMPQCLKVYHEMASNDAVIGACLYLMETMIRKANWKVMPASEDTQAQEIAQFVESCMYDMNEQTWDDFICEVLSMLIYGFSFHEIVYKIRRGPEERDPKYRSKYSDGKIGWRAMPIRAQTTLKEWVFDEKGNVTEFVQDPSQVNIQGPIVNIPIEGNLLFRTKSVRGNPEGWSILRRAYRSWYFKKYIEELEGIGIERRLAGIPVLQPPEELELFDDTNEQMRDLLGWATSLVNDLRTDRNHGVVLPAKWTLSLLTGKEGGAIDTDSIIRRYDARIATSMLSDVVLLGGDRTGSFALAEMKESLFGSAVQTIINSICNVLNQVAVPQLLVLNGMSTELAPKITTEQIKAPSINEVALLLRSAKISVRDNLPLYNYLMNLINGPAASSIEEIQNSVDPVEGAGGDDGEEQFQDSVDNTLKQSDTVYN